MERLRGGQRSSEPRKLVVSVFGKQGAGKTTFLLTFPPPLFVFNCDRPMGHLIEKLPPDIEIVYEAVPPDVDNTTPQAAGQVLQKFDALLAEALKAKSGSFLIDGFDLLWEYVKLAKIPRNSGTEPLPREWAEANTWMHSRLGALVSSPLQVGLSSMARRVWEGAKRETTMVEAEGFRHRGRWITLEGYLYSPEARDQAMELPQPSARGQSHSLYITTSKINEALVGAIIPNPRFDLLYKLVYEQGTNVSAKSE